MAKRSEIQAFHSFAKNKKQIKRNHPNFYQKVCNWNKLLLYENKSFILQVLMLKNNPKACVTFFNENVKFSLRLHQLFALREKCPYS